MSSSDSPADGPPSSPAHETGTERFFAAVARERQSYAAFLATAPQTEAHAIARARLGTDRELTDRAAVEAGMGHKRAVGAGLSHQNPVSFARLFEQAPGFMAMLRGPSHVFELVNPNYLKLVGDRQVVGKTVAQALPDAVEQGYLGLLDRVYATGEAYVADSAKYAVRAQLDGPVDERYLDFVFQPVRDVDGSVEGVFVSGVDSTERVLAQLKREKLAELTERVAMETSTSEVGFLAARMLGTVLGVGRVEFASVQPDTGALTVEKAWIAAGAETARGNFGLLGSGSLATLGNDELVAIRDVRDDARTAGMAQALDALSVRAIAQVPLFDRGRLVAVLLLGGTAARDWTADDLAFVKEAGHRTVGWVERLRQTTALRAGEAKLRAATDAANLGVWDLRLATQELTASKHCKSNFGRDLDAPFTYADLLAAVHPDDIARMRAAVMHTIATGDAYDIEYRIVRPDGGLAWVRVNGRLERDAAGTPLTMSGISQDITDLMLARRRAQLLDHLDREVYAGIGDPVEMAYGAAEALGRMLDVSRAGYGTINKQDETITIERDWNAPGIHTLAGTLHFRDYGSYIEDLKRGETVVFADARRDPRTRDNAEALIAISAQSAINMPVSEAGDLVAILYLNHATARPWTDDEMAVIKEVAHRTRQAVERRRAETDLRELAGSLERQVQERTAELMKSEAALRQSQKMEAVGQLTGGLAHDFNNLLAAVSGSLEMLRRRHQDDADSARYIDIGQTATKRAAALTHRLLAFSRQQTLEPKVLGVNQLIGGFEDLIRRTIGPQVTLEVVAGIGVWPVLADPGQLENALLNLCINARDAMPQGGRLMIESANRALDERTAGALEMLPGQYISICVSDTGSGMSPDVVARAFDPFFTTKPLGLGTGLGLSMVYGFARQSGGQARIYSEVGAGSNVCIYLPRFEGTEDNPGDAPQAPQPPGAPGIGETVLVVEDETSVRMLMVELLSEMGYQVLQAGDGPTGLEVLKATREVVLLVTDVGLPGGMNGRHLADAARVVSPALKVLFVTGYAENAVLSHGLLPTGMQVLTKPFDLDVFGQRVQTLVSSARSEARP